MGGKGSAPPPPDYIGAANTQAAASKELTNIQNFANRPTINTPFGSQSWMTSATTDPATGQYVTSWTQNNTLAPGLQDALNAQIGLQNERSQLAGSFMDRVSSEYSRPFDYQSLPQMAQANMAQPLQTRTTDYTPGITTAFGFGRPQGNVQTESLQRGLDTGDNPMLPQVDSGYRDRVADQLMQRMQPVHSFQQQQLETRLANQGFTQGSEAYNRALTELQQRQANERFNALDQAGNEAQRLFGMQMGARQQAFNEDVTGGNFYNQAANQAFNQGLQAGQFRNQAIGQDYSQGLGSAQFQNQALGQAQALDLARMQAQNQAIGQQYGLNQQFADAQNRLRQQAIAEQMQRRGMSLNEMNALLSGQQVNMPNMPSFAAAQRSETPNILGATQMGYDAALGAANAQNAAFGNLLGAGAQLGSAAFMFSDRRLKSNLKRVGTHSIGVGIYDYTMMGMPQRGVIAQEVERVRPDLVKRHASGYLMVNYGGLQ
jgi:hypothetical protein